VTLCCNSGGNLYTYPSTQALSCSLATTSSLWHHRLDHLGPSILAKLRNMLVISYNKSSTCLCHACQLGKHVRLPFSHSTSVTNAPFDLLHYDVWTSPVLSNSVFKYYLVLLDDFSHYCSSFLLRLKSEVHCHMIEFIAYAQTQFATTPRSFQADNGTEFVNHATASFLTSHGITLCLSCPYTLPQNIKAERMLRTTNNNI
jgi:transposase InsO family protein